MHEHALTIRTVRDGPVCATILRGGLDLGQTDGFLGQAVAAAGNRAGRLVLDPAGVTFPGCAGVPALAPAASFAPRGYPVIIRSLSPRERRTLELLDLGRTPHPASRPGATNHDPNLGWATSPKDLPRREPGRIREPREVRQMRAGRSLFEVVSGVPVVTAPKEIDIATAPALRSALLTAAAHGHGTLVLDMTMTRFCDSSGLHTLLAAHKRAQDEGGSLLLISPARAVLRVLEVTGLNRLLPSFTSLDQALAHIRRQAGQSLAT